MYPVLNKYFSYNKSYHQGDDFVMENVICKEQLGDAEMGDVFDKVIFRHDRGKGNQLVGRSLIFVGQGRSITRKISNWSEDWQDKSPSALIIVGYEPQPEIEDNETEEVNESEGNTDNPEFTV